MKQLVILFISSVLMYGCEKSKDGCIDPELKQVEVGCTQQYDPVCGCDGVTYPNSCIAKFQHGVSKFTTGACDCQYPFTGEVVDMTGLDGCGLMIRTDTGSLLEPINLPTGYKLQTGRRVVFDYEEVNSASICMAGRTVKITCIRDVGCLSLSEPLFEHDYNDAVGIIDAEIKGDCLYIRFNYGGGCADHDFKLMPTPLFCGTPPLPPTTLQFLHKGNNDLCEALIEDTISYDLRSLQDASGKSVEFYLQDQRANYNQKFVYQY